VASKSWSSHCYLAWLRLHSERCIERRSSSRRVRIVALKTKLGTSLQVLRRRPVVGVAEALPQFLAAVLIEKLQQRSGSRKCNDKEYVILSTCTSLTRTFPNLMVISQLAERVKKMATKTHKDRVHEFNSKLESLSEHHDIPKVFRCCATILGCYDSYASALGWTRIRYRIRLDNGCRLGLCA